MGGYLLLVSKVAENRHFYIPRSIFKTQSTELLQKEQLKKLLFQYKITPNQSIFHHQKKNNLLQKCE